MGTMSCENAKKCVAGVYIKMKVNFGAAAENCVIPGALRTVARKWNSGGWGLEERGNFCRGCINLEGFCIFR